MPRMQAYSNDEFRQAIEEPARTTYLLGRADAYARAAGDENVSHLIRKIAKCIAVDKGGVIARRLLQDLATEGS